MKKYLQPIAQSMTYITAIIPVFATCAPCPTCVPIYAAILSFFGLQLADYSAYLIPIMLCGMVTSLTIMYRQAIQKKLPLIPLQTILAAYLSLLIAKFYLHNTWIVYMSIVTMMGASYTHHLKSRNQYCDHSCKKC